jgi:hypothetical protein
MLCGCANLGGQLPPSHWRYLWHWSWICPQLRPGQLCWFVHGGYDSVERSERGWESCHGLVGPDLSNLKAAGHFACCSLSTHE